MKRGYDNIAFFYDRLARLVYGRALVSAQRFLIQAIPPGAKVLIIGGGTGWILEEIAKVQPAGLVITYVDSSPKMIALARSRNAGGNIVHFIDLPVESITADGHYDIILTPFLFDNFIEEQMQQVFIALHQRLKYGGKWLYADFKDNGQLWQKMMLRIMYAFFRLTCGIAASKLPDVAVQFGRYGYKAGRKQQLLRGFIIATVYSREE